MPIQHAVLALLAEGESYGYELRNEFRESIGPQWGDLNIGHVYQVLDRLIRDGLVTKREVSQHRRPDKVMFRLTEAGERELTGWLETPSTRQAGYRDDVFLKLFAASRLGAKPLRQVIRTQRESYLGELSSLQALRTEGHEPLVDLLVEAAILDTEAKLRVLELAESRQRLLLRKDSRAITPAAEPIARPRARSAG
ncbi:MAG: PadR family transcriptional regulator [Gaiellaceae bacterium]